MINIVTSNIIPISSIKDYNDNFVISHLISEPIIPMNSDGYHYRIYYQSEMELDTYSSRDEFKFDYIETADITQALDAIIQTILHQEQTADEDSDPEEIMLLVACDHNWNNQVVKYLNDKLEDSSSQITCLDIYDYLNKINTEKLVQTLKQTLGTEFIYPEEPVSFGYAIYEALESRWG